MGRKRKALREVLAEKPITAGMLAHIEFAGKEEESTVLPAAQLWKRQDLLDMTVIWSRVDKDEFKRPRMIVLLSQPKKAR